MSAERDREQAIHDGVVAVHTANPINTEQAVAALLDAGWVPPRQHDEELAAIASWQRDARGVFAHIEAIAAAHEIMWHPIARSLAEKLRYALGEQFSTPRTDGDVSRNGASR